MKKNGNPRKGIFILFLFYSVTGFLSFAIFINSCSDTILKNIALFQRTKKAPLSRCFTYPRSGMPPVKENFSLYFSAKPPRKIMQSIVFYISAPPDMIDKII